MAQWYRKYAYVLCCLLLNCPAIKMCITTTYRVMSLNMEVIKINICKDF